MALPPCVSLCTKQDDNYDVTTFILLLLDGLEHASPLQVPEFDDAIGVALTAFLEARILVLKFESWINRVLSHNTKSFDGVHLLHQLTNHAITLHEVFDSHGGLLLGSFFGGSCEHLDGTMEEYLYIYMNIRWLIDQGAFLDVVCLARDEGLDVTSDLVPHTSLVRFIHHLFEANLLMIQSKYVVGRLDPTRQQNHTDPCHPLTLLGGQRILDLVVVLEDLTQNLHLLPMLKLLQGLLLAIMVDFSLLSEDLYVCVNIVMVFTPIIRPADYALLRVSCCSRTWGMCCSISIFFEMRSPPSEFKICYFFDSLIISICVFVCTYFLLEGSLGQVVDLLDGLLEGSVLARMKSRSELHLHVDRGLLWGKYGQVDRVTVELNRIARFVVLQHDLLVEHLLTIEYVGGVGVPRQEHLKLGLRVRVVENCAYMMIGYTKRVVYFDPSTWSRGTWRCIDSNSRCSFAYDPTLLASTLVVSASNWRAQSSHPNLDLSCPCCWPTHISNRHCTCENKSPIFLISSYSISWIFSPYSLNPFVTMIDCIRKCFPASGKLFEDW